MSNYKLESLHQASCLDKSCNRNEKSLCCCISWSFMIFYYFVLNVERKSPWSGDFHLNDSTRWSFLRSWCPVSFSSSSFLHWGAWSMISIQKGLSRPTASVAVVFCKMESLDSSVCGLPEGEESTSGSAASDLNLFKKFLTKWTLRRREGWIEGKYCHGSRRRF